VFLLKLSILHKLNGQAVSNQDELNKQVFALLLLNRFIGEIHLPANLEELLFRLAREVPVNRNN
jgi:hypothetical protein